MSPLTTTPSTARLSSLIVYTEALWSSLSHHDDDSGMLWVVTDTQAQSTLHQLLIAQDSRAAATAAVSTISDLHHSTIQHRYALVCFWLPQLSADTLQLHTPTLMRYRDLYAAHMLVALDSQLSLQAYGFTPLDFLEKPQSQATAPRPLITLWQFNLYDYKKRPNWLNSDYWANPEHWDKHRW